MKFINFIAVVMILSGCASTSYEQKDTSTAAYGGKTVDESSGKDISSEDRVIIFNADITIQTDDTAALSVQVASLAARYGGYVVSTSSSLVVIRVQADKFEQAVGEIKKMGEDVDVRVFSEDVTEVYRDTQIRLDNKLKARERYLELLKRAENVQAALQVERELERLNVEIEELKGRITRISHLARYSTISVRIEEEVKPGPLGYIFYGMYRVVKWLFIRN
ncbi:MAG TPA: DUF4349 domain-containing protein [Spirochaetota bacterium]|nr:DUF4349 domain-containing protein [Spirochaetota bacterium]